MRTISKEQNELIDALAAEGGLGKVTPAIVEKDIHVTDALRSLAGVQHDHLHLVFCGGTSLSKAHGIIERMSEDIDLKMVLVSDHGMSEGQLKKHLSSLKQKVVGRMDDLGFETVEDETRARNANRYFASGWRYRPLYRAHGSLRTHLSLEFTARTPHFATPDRPLDYLVNRLANQKGNPFLMPCVAVEETLGEKVLSFLRRFAEHRAGVRDDWDEALVRHIYDTWRIVSVDKTTVDRAASHFKDLVSFDRIEFPKHAAFVADPAKCMKETLATVEYDAQTASEYANKLLPLIYGTDRPSFKEAFAVFKEVAVRLIGTL